jgi:hypothetical protein
MLAGTCSIQAGESTNLDYYLQLARKREPIGSTTYCVATTNDDNQITLHYHNNTSGSNWVVNGGPVPISLPHKYKDPDSGIVFEVESDGRHVVATDANGKMLWRRDPFADAHLELYRTTSPKIVYIRNLRKDDEPHQWIRKTMEERGVTNFICINFNSSQSGCLDIRSGDFTFLGQR